MGRLPTVDRLPFVLAAAVAVLAAGCFSETTGTTTARPSTTTLTEVTITLPSTTVAPPSTTTTISVPSATPLFTMASEILPASEDPFEWRWESFDSETSEATGMQKLVNGNNCYGSGSPLLPPPDLEFNGVSIEIALGYRSTPDIVVTDAGGTVTQVGNPFGELAWLCSVGTNDTHILAVGSGVSWSDDGIAWHGIEAFEQFAGSNIDGSELLWAAAGPGGYMVLGREGVVWFSEDLETWHEIHLENDGYGTSVWGWVGPISISVDEEVIINMFDEGWIGTRP